MFQEGKLIILILYQQRPSTIKKFEMFTLAPPKDEEDELLLKAIGNEGKNTPVPFIRLNIKYELLRSHTAPFLWPSNFSSPKVYQ